jgi:hypothetical protein
MKLPQMRSNRNKFKIVAKLTVSTTALQRNAVEQQKAKQRANPDDWNEKKAVGVRFWVHKHTGEVTTDCPFLIKEIVPPKQMTPKRGSVCPQQQHLSSQQRLRQSLSPPRRTSLLSSKVESPSHKSTIGLHKQSFSSPPRSRGRDNSSNQQYWNLRKTRSKSVDYDVGVGTAPELYDHGPIEELFQLLEQYKKK